MQSSFFIHTEGYKKGKDVDNTSKPVTLECTKTLLFCYQSQFMKELMTKYGNSLALVGATDKTTDNALLAVKTSTGSVISVVFIVQFETYFALRKPCQCSIYEAPNSSPSTG